MDSSRPNSDPFNGQKQQQPAAKPSKSALASVGHRSAPTPLPREPCGPSSNVLDSPATSPAMVELSPPQHGNVSGVNSRRMHDTLSESSDRSSGDIPSFQGFPEGPCSHTQADQDATGSHLRNEGGVRRRNCTVDTGTNRISAVLSDERAVPGAVGEGLQAGDRSASTSDTEVDNRGVLNQGDTALKCS